MNKTIAPEITNLFKDFLNDFIQDFLDKKDVFTSSTSVKFSNENLNHKDFFLIQSDYEGIDIVQVTKIIESLREKNIYLFQL